MSPFAEQYGPWAVVAGASVGLGAAYAEALAARGLNLVLIARRPAELETLAASVRTRFKVEVKTLSLDLAAPEAPGRILAFTADLQLGLLVFNAAFSPLGAFVEVPVASALKAVDLNAHALVELTHGIASRLVSQKRGGIVLLSSLTASAGSPFLATYGATKAFTATFADALWVELKPHNIDVLAVLAGATRTPGFEKASPDGAPGLLEPSVVAEQSLVAIKKGPRFIPGAFNRFASAFMSLLPARSRLGLMADQTKKLKS